MCVCVLCAQVNVLDKWCLIICPYNYATNSALILSYEFVCLYLNGQYSNIMLSWLCFVMAVSLKRSNGLIIPQRSEESYHSTEEQGATALSFYRGTRSSGR